MNLTPFRTTGALTDIDAAIYVERQADRDTLVYLRAMNYLLVIEPRHQGKTSLINRLRRHPALGDVALVYVDVTTLDCATEATWYGTLCQRILHQLRGSISRDQWPVIPQSSAGWRDFLSDLAALAIKTRQRLVIALDEIGFVNLPGATKFFSVLRTVYDWRHVETEFNQLTFLLAGVFHPRDLIKDDKISPFNVAQRVRLADFTAIQVLDLVSKGNWPEDQATRLAERVYYWTDGQPYLTQMLCSYLGPDAKPADVDTGVTRLLYEDAFHLPSLLRRLNEDRNLYEYVARVQAGERIRFYPRENRRQAQLELLGALKADSNGYCTIRNRVYETALTETKEPSYSVSAVAPLSQDGFSYDVFISYSHKDSVWVRDTLLPYLEGEGLRVAIDYRDFKVGAPSLVNMENAVERSRKTLLVLTPNWVASEWTEFEALLIQTQDPAGRGRRILPLMVQQSELPGRLQVFTYLDLTDPAEFDFQMKRLVATIRSAPQPPAPIEPTLAETPVAPVRPVARGFSHERGLAALRDHLSQADAETRLGFAVLESRMLENLQDERRYGTSETIRSERARIVQELNRLALTHLGRSFNDLCGS